MLAFRWLAATLLLAVILPNDIICNVIAASDSSVDGKENGLHNHDASTARTQRHSSEDRLIDGTTSQPQQRRQRQLRNFVGRITSLQLINAITNTKIVDIVNGDVIDMSQIQGGMNNTTANNSTTTPLPSFNIVAGTDKNRYIKSVKFLYNGTTPYIEDTAPYAFCSKTIVATTGATEYFVCNQLRYGNNTITAIPYTRRSGLGRAGTSMTLSFRIVPNKNQTIY